MPLPEDETEWKNLMVVFATSKGNVRKNTLEDFININNSGKIAMKLDQDSVVQTLSVNTHTSVLFFSTEGLVYKIKAWKIPEGSSSSKGKSLFNILPLKSHQAISSIMPMPEDETDLKNYQLYLLLLKERYEKIV